MCPPTLKRWVIDAHSSAGGPFGGAVSIGGMVARERDIGKRPARLPPLGARDRYVAARCGPSAAAAFRLLAAGAVPLASARGPGLALSPTDCRCGNCRRPVRAEPGGRWSVAAASAPSAGDRAGHLPLFTCARARDKERVLRARHEGTSTDSESSEVASRELLSPAGVERSHA